MPSLQQTKLDNLKSNDFSCTLQSTENIGHNTKPQIWKDGGIQKDMLTGREKLGVINW